MRFILGVGCRGGRVTGTWCLLGFGFGGGRGIWVGSRLDVGDITGRSLGNGFRQGLGAR